MKNKMKENEKKKKKKKKKKKNTKGKQRRIRNKIKDDTIASSCTTSRASVISILCKYSHVISFMFMLYPYFILLIYMLLY